ncbi:TIM-barrel domain-containing protein [Pedobacter aquatilis]|uniref:TIM-barrel domain-containing protein n=1 Tax=Pedobacter aquatilis TaxID=351343 RepID=UPI00292FD389|nr:TIM-barrel domain-containing protein [Pedobacter aquatilis]
MTFCSFISTPIFSTIKNTTVNLVLGLIFTPAFISAQSIIKQEKAVKENPIDSIEVLNAKKVNHTTVALSISNKGRMFIDFYGDNIFRLFLDPKGGMMHNPEAKPSASILVENPRMPISTLNLSEENNQLFLSTEKITILIDKKTSLIKVINRSTQALALEALAPVQFEKDKITLSFKENPWEYFYGGGVQNGRFSHKGKAIAIENQNSWTDGGVASPTPFYWSTNGYGILFNTFKKGNYNFGAGKKGLVKLSHESDYLDMFFMIDDKPEALLNDFYQLTGNPVLLPKFGFYEGHLNAYNRDFWKEGDKGVLFEDGKHYKESQKDNGGIKESLNGEKENYQFSARAVIDRYRKNDMPLGWVLPNDGYGAGYGQRESLDGNIENLKLFGDYARKNGVEIGLWTQSDLHPKAGISPLLQRDIIKEVKDAGVRVLKTDVAWVGAGYSFGLNGVTDVAQIMPKYGNNSRPFIISLDGWAGTQRFAGLWSGDQTGGNWEYIRFHIPTYLGSGLSGQPNITSDMDGIFGGLNPVINTRDFQWKTFTPMQLNMDGWGANEKYPHAMGEPYTSINRTYLKLKSELIPYTYSIAKEAVRGLPMVRAMLLAYPNAYTKGISTQYQFLYGPSFLVAPIYQITRPDDKGNDIRNGIYLPEGTWIDYFTGEKYSGNCILNSFDAPLWKLPVFVKAGAIIPMANENNNVSQINRGNRIYQFYPSGKTSFTEYDDDGTSEAYKLGHGTSTSIASELNEKHQVHLMINPTKGDFNGFIKEKTTQLVVNLTQKPKSLGAQIGTTKLKLREVSTRADFLAQRNVYFYDAAPNLNRFSTKGTAFEKIPFIKNAQLFINLQSTDISKNQVRVVIEGYKFEPKDKQHVLGGKLTTPANALISKENKGAYTLKPTWNKTPNADFYEIDFGGMRYTSIKDTALLFEGLLAETTYSFKLRAVNKDGYSGWTTLNATTKANPLAFAIQGIMAKSSVENQGGFGLEKLFDFDEGNLWHTKWGLKAIPFDVVIDLKSQNQLDKFHYLPRKGKGNGTLLKGQVFYSENKVTWTSAGTFEWENNDETKIFNFPMHPTASYLKITALEGVNSFGSGRELYVFKVPGTESFLSGDINNDHIIDQNDLTSYINYTGLRKGDADFEGYIVAGDINKNNLIDAYDISVVSTQLEGAVNDEKIETLAGNIQISTIKQTYNKDEIIEVKVKGLGLKAVNALSFAIPYDVSAYDYLGLQPLNLNRMENLTNDRLHTSGDKVLYPTFVNLGQKETLNGTEDLFILKFRAKRKLQFNLKAQKGLLVDKNLNSIQF